MGLPPNAPGPLPELCGSSGGFDFTSFLRSSLYLHRRSFLPSPASPPASNSPLPNTHAHTHTHTLGTPHLFPRPSTVDPPPSLSFFTLYRQQAVAYGSGGVDPNVGPGAGCKFGRGGRMRIRVGGRMRIRAGGRMRIRGADAETGVGQIRIRGPDAETGGGQIRIRAPDAETGGGQIRIRAIRMLGPLASQMSGPTGLGCTASGSAYNGMSLGVWGVPADEWPRGF